jgi:hypothetical protein
MTDPFTPNSRYYNLPLRTRTTKDGTTQTFVGRRIIPAVERYRPLDRHRTIDRDRIDNVAAAAFGDPEQYWRICDANGDAEPAQATQPVGRLVVIPLPLEMADDGES